MCFVCSKQLSYREGSFEYPQHMFQLRNKKNNFQLHTLIWGPGTIMSTLRFRIMKMFTCNLDQILPKNGHIQKNLS